MLLLLDLARINHKTKAQDLNGLCHDQGGGSSKTSKSHGTGVGVSSASPGGDGRAS